MSTFLNIEQLISLTFTLLCGVILTTKASAQRGSLELMGDSVTKDYLLKVPEAYVNDVVGPNRGADGKQTENEKYFNNQMLNVLFAQEVNSVIHGSTDINTQRYHATLTNEDNAFSFGMNFGWHQRKTDKLTHLLSLGVSASSKSGFATVIKNGDLQNDINSTIKYTRVGRGIIRYGTYGEAVKGYRTKYLKPKLQKEIAGYVAEGKAFDQTINAYKAAGEDVDEKGANLVKKKYQEYYVQFAEEEIQALREHKWYKWLWDHYASVEVSLPVSKKEYKLTDSLQNALYNKQAFYAYRVTAVYTNMMKWSGGGSAYLNLIGKAYNNNNIELEELDGSDFQTILGQSNTNIAVTETNKVYVGDYMGFLSYAIGGELIIFPAPFKGVVGLSASAEQIFGEHEAINWKLGIPFSLKDKEGKPKVNFEVQWKEVNKDHLLGVRVGFVFGKFVY